LGAAQRTLDNSAALWHQSLRDGRVRRDHEAIVILLVGSERVGKKEDC